MLKEFLDNHPGAEIQGCASGGEITTNEVLRYVQNMQLTDGNAYQYAGYYSSLRMPLSKTGHIFTAGPEGVGTNFSTLDPKSEDTKESTRKAVERGRYLKQEGVSGRWVKTCRPTISGERDKSHFLQSMNVDNTKGIFLLSNIIPYNTQSFTIYPKGLLADTDYTVRSVLGSVITETQSGSYWMTNGIPVVSLEAGDLISMKLRCSWMRAACRQVPVIMP